MYRSTFIAFLLATLSACSPSKDVESHDAGADAGCGQGEKRCGVTCVSLASATTGCASEDCKPCSFDHGVPECVDGKCSLASCNSGFADCNGDALDGCEAALSNDRSNCGACGVSCSSAEVCENGSCASNCGVALTDCNGACVALKIDPQNCGACGFKCPVLGPGETAVCNGGVCSIACASGYTACGSDCVFLENDPGNCGACGHSCWGGACVAAACQPIQIGAGPTGGWCLDLGGSNVYWTASGDPNIGSDDELLTASISGGTTAALISGGSSPRCLAVSGTTVAWASPFDGTVWASTTSGASKVQIANGQSEPYAIDIASNFVFWTTAVPGGALWSFELATSTPPVKIVQNLATPPTVRAESGPGFVYFITRGDPPSYVDGGVSRVPYTGGAASVLAANQVNAVGLALAGSSIYWTTRGTEGSFDNGTVSRAFIDGQSPQTLASGLAGVRKGIASDGKDVYFSTWVSGTDGAILKVPAFGGNVVTMATGQAAPADIAVDDFCVYWVNEASGAVMKVAK